MNAIDRMWLAGRNAVDRLNGWYRRQVKLAHDSLLRRLTRRRPPIGLPIIVLAVLAAAIWAGSATAAPAGCFHYGEVVTLSGQYFARVAPADDGIIRDARNDAARRATLLKLTTPFCVNADDISAAVAASLTIQLNCPALRTRDGSELTIKGRLIGAHTGNGQTPVLLMCL